MQDLEGQNNFVSWDEEGCPYSTLFKDKYFCTQDAYQESLFISCQGNKLQERFSKLDDKVRGVFTIIETGFGTGLNFCSAWQLWNENAPRSWKLHFISIELYPMSSEFIHRALSAWSCLSSYRDALVNQYQPLLQGTSHVYFDGQRVQLSLVFDDVVDALKQIKESGICPQGADAWFLSGFAPAKNPRMWSPEVFKGMALLSHPGTSFSTFTVAGEVCRGLAAEGFVVEKNFAKNKRILTGVFHKEKI